MPLGGFFSYRPPGAFQTLQDLPKSQEHQRENKISKPLVVKLSPDISSSDIGKIIELIIKYKIDGIIVSNTTDSNRESLTDEQKKEKGGLSGQPLKHLSTNLIKKFYRETKGKIQIIGVGGVDSGKAAFEKFNF